MRKIICLAMMLTLVAGICFPQNEKTDRGFLVTTGVLYNSEKIDSDPQFNIGGMNYAIGLGYDFEPVTINLQLDFMLIEQVEYQGYGYSRNPQITKGDNGGLGLNLGIKLVNGPVFDVILPLGFLFRSNSIELTHDNERKFKYTYLNIESGLILLWHLTKSFAVYVPFNIGYPVSQKSEVENYAKNDYDVLHYSFGIGFQINCSNLTL
jgi:hypothetical protein